jgi:hypothetical protein
LAKSGKVYVRYFHLRESWREASAAFTGSDENEVIRKALVWCDGENALAILELVKTIRRAEYRRASKRIEPQPNKNQTIAPNPQISQRPKKSV